MRQKMQRQQRKGVNYRTDNSIFRHTAGKTHSLNVPDTVMRGGHRF